MSPEEFETVRRGLLRYFTEGSDSIEANEALVETTVTLTRYEPESAWQLILLTIRDVPAEKDLSILGAGPLEDLIARHGTAFIDRIEQEALRNPRFREVLSSVWKSDAEESVWQRLHDFVLAHRDEWNEPP